MAMYEENSLSFPDWEKRQLFLQKQAKAAELEREKKEKQRMVDTAKREAEWLKARAAWELDIFQKKADILVKKQRQLLALKQKGGE